MPFSYLQRKFELFQMNKYLKKLGDQSVFSCDQEKHLIDGIKTARIWIYYCFNGYFDGCFKFTVANNVKHGLSSKSQMDGKDLLIWFKV
jgi:hypothetical protein